MWCVSGFLYHLYLYHLYHLYVYHLATLEGATVGGSSQRPLLGAVIAQVVELHVAIANGTVIKVSRSSHPHLFRALVVRGLSTRHGHEQQLRDLCKL
jgi:hypothetical protein